ncbi:MAG: RecQ family ATP-dependent DNA helicase [Phycisphaerae bacterium]|nr:RecQ family ATP-dependent DNA helicase [Phycisphaerae bacterium]
MTATKPTRPDEPPAATGDLESRVLQVLLKYWGFDVLRPLQLEAIAAGVSRRDSLVVLPTGGGKSVCYQIPPLLTGKLGIVISPLISLMKDQVDGLKLANYPAAAIFGGMDANQIGAIRREALSGRLKLLLVAPERILSDSFLTFLRAMDDGPGLGGFSIDEAHCISQWGHDFRPEYRRLAELREYFPDLPLHAYTATATPRVREDIVQQLALRDPEVLVGIFDRPNLTYRILPRVNADDQIEEALRRHEGRAAIVYCISRKETERLAASLTGRGLRADSYHAGMTPVQRHKVQDAFASERLNIVVATVAFGMGIDRSDVRCVIHAMMPKTVEHYQQETGRAGRDGLPSECVLFYSSADVMQWKRLMEFSAQNAETCPPPEAVEAQHELLEHMQRLSNGARCRHRSLSEYFGQSYPNSNCGACDLCLNELAPVPDVTTVARKIISCVARLYQASNTGFGAAYIAEVLRGAQIKRIVERRHDQLSTFGLMRELAKERIVSYINQLVDAGALVRTTGEYAVILTCAGSAAVLKGQIEVSLFDPVSTVALPKRRGSDPAAAGETSSDERGLFEFLRTLRRVVAESRGLPAYLVFGDNALEDMARVRPATLETFADIRGVGAAKLADFGEQFTVNIAQYCREHNLATDVAERSRPRQRLAAEPRGDRPPTEARKQAFALYARGASIDEVMQKTGYARSTSAQCLAEWISSAKPSSVAAWVDEKVYALIADAAEKMPEPRYKIIFDHFGGEFSYDQIRVVLTHRNALRA